MKLPSYVPNTFYYTILYLLITISVFVFIPHHSSNIEILDMNFSMLILLPDFHFLPFLLMGVAFFLAAVFGYYFQTEKEKHRSTYGRGDPPKPKGKTNILATMTPPKFRNLGIVLLIVNIVQVSLSSFIVQTISMQTIQLIDIQPLIFFILFVPLAAYYSVSIVVIISFFRIFSWFKKT